MKEHGDKDLTLFKKVHPLGEGWEKEKERFGIKDSGKREEFASGMVRDTQEGKVEGDRMAEGPMLERWAVHLTKGAAKYPDRGLGRANWTLAAGEEEYIRFRKSAWRHFMQWWRGEIDEDHAAAVFFNINGAEYVKEVINGQQEPGSTESARRPQHNEDYRPNDLDQN